MLRSTLVPTRSVDLILRNQRIGREPRCSDNKWLALQSAWQAMRLLETTPRDGTERFAFAHLTQRRQARTKWPLAGSFPARCSPQALVARLFPALWRQTGGPIVPHAVDNEYFPRKRNGAPSPAFNSRALGQWMSLRVSIKKRPNDFLNRSGKATRRRVAADGLAWPLRESCGHW